MMSPASLCAGFFFFNDTATTEIYTLSLHDALPICVEQRKIVDVLAQAFGERHDDRKDHRGCADDRRSEEHTSELQSPCNLVCRLLLEKKEKDLLHLNRPHTPAAHATTSIPRQF